MTDDERDEITAALVEATEGLPIGQIDVVTKHKAAARVVQEAIAALGKCGVAFDKGRETSWARVDHEPGTTVSVVTKVVVSDEAQIIVSRHRSKPGEIAAFPVMLGEFERAVPSPTYDPFSARWVDVDDSGRVTSGVAAMIRTIGEALREPVPALVQPRRQPVK